MTCPPCVHSAGEYAKLLGMATPPTSYGGYGGNANEKPKYTFEYPAGWKPEVPSKVRPDCTSSGSRHNPLLRCVALPDNTQA